MLTAYTRMWQEGIERLKNYTEPVKDEKSGHYYFDDFRIALRYHFNERDNTSGVGVLIFAPNGSIWCQRGIYCFELDKYGSIYQAIDQILEEAEKSKAKNLTFFIEDKAFVNALKHQKPFKVEAYNIVHKYVIDKLKRYPKYQFVFRNNYSKELQERIEKQAKEAARTPEFDNRGQWQNQIGIIYFNIKEQSEEEMKAFARQYADMFLDFFDSYMKEYEQDYGKEAYQNLIAKIKAGKMKSLPSVKRVKAKEERFVKVKNYPKLKKVIVCQHCQTEMQIETCLMKYPEKELRYFLRCKKCQATREMNEKGRTIKYGKYPRKIPE